MDMDVVRIIAAIFLPPLGVFLQVGFGKDFWINLLLTIFGFYILGIRDNLQHKQLLKMWNRENIVSVEHFT